MIVRILVIQCDPNIVLESKAQSRIPKLIWKLETSGQDPPGMPVIFSPDLSLKFYLKSLVTTFFTRIVSP